MVGMWCKYFKLENRAVIEALLEHCLYHHTKRNNHTYMIQENAKLQTQNTEIEPKFPFMRAEMQMEDHTLL